MTKQDPQSTRAMQRDQAATDTWEKMTDEEKAPVRKATRNLLAVRGMGELSVAELLVALADAGFLDEE